MNLTGYSDIWSVRPGAEIAFHVHCAAPRYRAQLVRLLHGDENPAGPGFKEIELASPLDGEHAGAARRIRKGSYGAIDIGGLLDGVPAFTLSVWIWPTLPDVGEQGLMSWFRPAPEMGLGLFISERGTVEARCADAPPLRSPLALRAREWYRVTLAVDRTARTIALEVVPKRWEPGAADREHAQATLGPAASLDPGSPLLLGAGWLADTPDGPEPVAVFNGKLARPAVLGPDGAMLAAWDLGRRAGSRTIVAVAGGRDGRTCNRPARAMTGPFWPKAPSSAPSEPTHDAIHFHDDDVADVGWPESHRWRVPAELESGVYALRLRAGTDEDYLPLFVCPPAGEAGSPLAVLMPTLSYLAYANESIDASDTVQLAPLQDMSLRADAYRYVAENGLKSTYDVHRDGSGICHGSRRRPMVDFRPKARCRTFSAPHQLAADLHLVDWLTHKGFAFDVLTDDLLHAEGTALLSGYRVVLTGSHPEYWSARMLDARDAWLAAGGRLMYLGGNGFYWATGVAEDEPDVIEIRRYGGTRTWTGEPGEATLSVTGGRGGLWRDSGRPPQAVMGIGFSGQGFDRGVPYRRSADSFAPAWSWIFRGVASEIVGDGPSLVLNHGAAGYEIDRIDPREGTPAHTVVLASSLPFTDAYQAAIETLVQTHPWTGGSHARARVRSDMVILPGPYGGAVFATGSITWCASLSASGYDSDASRITENVLNGFLAEAIPGAG